MKLPFQPRLLPMALAAMALLAAVKIERLITPGHPPGHPSGHPSGGIAARASAQEAARPAQPQGQPQGQPQAQTPTRTPTPGIPIPAPTPTPAATAPTPPSPEQLAERAVLESLRARRLDIERRGDEVAQRELLLTAAERRLGERLDELRALQGRLEGDVRSRSEREEAGIRQLVRVYEAMRPRDAATILDDLDMPILLQVLDRMREAKAAPVLAAMRPERARAATTELSRLRTNNPNP